MHTAQPCKGTPLWAPRLMYQGSGSSMLYWSCRAPRYMSLYSYEAYCCSVNWLNFVGFMPSPVESLESG